MASDLALGKLLDVVCGPKGLSRMWSRDPQQDFVVDHLRGGYCETDAAFRARVKASLEE